MVASSTLSDLDPSLTIVTVPDARTSYRVCGLVPSVQYRFTVAAATRQAQGQQATYRAWTVLANPTQPDRPTVVYTNSTSVTIEIKPVILVSGPVTGYFIVVYRPPQSTNLITRQKRQITRLVIPDPTQFIPMSGRTVAFIPKVNLPDRRWFTVGDNLTWGGYSNPALLPNTRYDIAFVVMSSLDGETKMAFTELQVRTLPDGGGDSDSDNNRLWIILGVILGFLGLLFLIFLIILLIVCCYRYWTRRHQSDNER